MDTLLITENDRKVRDHLRKLREQGLPAHHPGGGGRIRHPLRVDVIQTPAGDPAQLGAMLAGSAAQIVRGVLTFADGVLTRATSDIGQFRVIFMFHQTSANVVRALNDAFQQLDGHPTWERLAVKHTRHLRVKRVWLMSCESATDLALPPNPSAALQQYAAQAGRMRSLAAAAFRTRQTPPPPTPMAFYHPFVHTLSTGDPVTGGIVLDPANVTFRRLPGHFDANGGWVWDPTPAGQSDDAFHQGQPAGGTLYTHEDGRLIESTPIPAGGGLAPLTPEP